MTNTGAGAAQEPGLAEGEEEEEDEYPIVSHARRMLHEVPPLGFY